MNVFIFIGLFFAMLVATIVILLLKKENKPSGKKSNDYMNDPQFNYMSCNKFNPKSPLFKKLFKKKPFKKKSINNLHKKELIIDIKNVISTLKSDDTYSRNPNNLTNLRNRIKSSLEIYEKYIT